MKIILLEDVDNLGDKFQIKTVAAGYARNFLIPQGLAVAATDSEVKQLEQKIKFAERREQRIEKELAKKLSKLTGASIEIKEQSGPDGKLYGSVSAKQIAAILTEQLGVEVNKKRIGLKSPVKAVGEYTFPFTLGDGKKTDITLKVVSANEEVVEAKAEAAPEAAPEAAETSEAAAEE